MTGIATPPEPPVVGAGSAGPVTPTPGPTRPGTDTKGRPRKQEQEPASEEITEVAPGVLRLQLPIWMPGLGHVNTYALVDRHGVALVDPGLPGPRSWRELRRRLRRAGFRLRDVHHVIVTHSHPDHFGAAGRIRREVGAQLVTHKAFTTWSLQRRAATVSEAEAERIEREAIEAAARYGGPSLEEVVELEGITQERQRQSVPWGGSTPWGGSRHPLPPWHRRLLIRALRLLFVPPDPTRRVIHGSPLRLAEREWLAVHTPGHTLDHLCLWDPEGGVLLSGDHVLPTITPHIAGSAQGDSLSAYLATLDLVARLDGVRLGLPAHGHPFTDVPGRVAAIRAHHHERMERLRAASQAVGPADVRTLSRELFPRWHWGVMAESETFAHLEHLRRGGEAERWEEADRFVYRVAPGHPTPDASTAVPPTGPVATTSEEPPDAQ